MDSGKETRTREGMTGLATLRKKKREKKITSWLHCMGSSHMCAGGYENNEKNKGIKGNEVERSWIASTDAH